MTGRGRLAAAGVAVVTAAALLQAGAAQAAPRRASFTDYSYTATAAGLADVRRIVRDDVAAAAGYTGKGVGIALIDTGVVPVPGLTSGNVANGPDLSLESQVPGLTRRDSYGHGTHLAGIIAGRDAGGGGFRGMAPDAKLLSVKVGAANGAVDVTQVMAAVDWVVAHRNDDPANPIKVLNLSYGTDSTQSWVTSPLSEAVENAYRAGISVVVAAGNTGGNILLPGSNPYIITVGATDPQGTTNPADDRIASFSSTGTWGRAPDVMAPGRSIVSLRDPGSYADVNYPSARVGDRFFTGSGTSQAAAVVSGAAAVLLQKYPHLSPTQVMCHLRGSGTRVAGSYAPQVNLERALQSRLTRCGQGGTPVTGTGSIQRDRGTSLVTMGDGVPLTGERDIFGPLSSSVWARASAAHTSWRGGDWMGRPWTGTGWTTPSDGQANWSGKTWSGKTWSGKTWSDIAWAAQSWNGKTWSNSDGAAPMWSGASWSLAGWLSAGDKGWLS
ncbi:S8 family serine peptidase [Actinoplanes sp. NPDC049316]|uniref:S8 family serine peptidase n=1 Tax=Actinoplanes sp. NPDC049316 TaxID=3154727 RepID=UPI003426BEFA